MEEYITVAKPGMAQFTEKRSRFIGRCIPISSEEEALAFIKEISSKHWDARHNVYAYIVRSGQIMRYSDDGEPQGTAGIPVLDMLKKEGLTNVAVVVTRYFGGILLGTGGLVRAYSHSAALAVKEAQIITMRECIICNLKCDYNKYGKISSAIIDKGGVIDNTAYSDFVDIYFHISEDGIPSLDKALAEITGGKASIIKGEKNFYQVL